MELADFCDYCLGMPGAEATTPFGPGVIVYKVGGKMFATASPDECPHRVNLKCDPDRAVALRDRHEEILPGYHMNKRHWNTLLVNRLPSPMVEDLIRHSHALVVASLPKTTRQNLGMD